MLLHLFSHACVLLWKEAPPLSHRTIKPPLNQVLGDFYLLGYQIAIKAYYKDDSLIELYIYIYTHIFPGGSEGKASACKAGELGSIPGSERSPGEGNGNPLQYACLEHSMDRGAWWATVHEVTKSQTRLSDFTFTFTYIHTYVYFFFNFFTFLEILSFPEAYIKQEFVYWIFQFTCEAITNNFSHWSL